MRFRITPDELEALLRGEAVREALAVPGGGNWDAILAGEVGCTRLLWQEGAAHVALALEDVVRLSDPAVEGVYFQTPAPESVRFYVEKDFPCAHPGLGEAGEEQASTFSRQGETSAPEDGG